MPSRSFINVVTSFAIIEGALNMLEEANKDRPDDPIHGMIKEIKVNLDKAQVLWKGGLDSKVFFRISNKLIEWEALMFPERKVDIVILSSLGLAMLDEIMLFVKDSRRLACITAIHDGLIKIHQHFDPNFDELELFEVAAKAFESWKEIQKGA